MRTPQITAQPQIVIRFKTLGPPDLVGSDGQTIASILAGPKRVALLAYLAVEGANGWVRRDTLLPLFWPESDTDRARASLRSALLTLRRSLGDRVVVVRGDEEVGLAPERVWCDAAAFRTAIAAGELEQALELYRGDFLQGFFLSEAAEFEHWLDRTRMALRNQAIGAATALAQRNELNGQPEVAARWAARASELDPEDERLLRQRMEILERQGDRAAALRVYDEMARRLTQELGIEPSAQTRALAQSLRMREAEAVPRPPSVPAPSPRHEEAENVAGRQAPPPPVVPRTRSAPNRVHRAGILAALLLLVVALGAVWAVWQRDRTQDPSLSSTRIAVFPFTVRGTDSLAYLGEGMVELLSAKLDGAGDLQSVDPRAVLGLLAREPTEYLDPEQARGLAVRMGAGHYVLGTILEVGGRIQLDASLYDLRGRLETAAQVAGQDESHLFDLVDRLTARLIAGQSRGPAGELTRLAALTTPSLSALKAYLHGERSFRQQRYGEAIASLQQAVELDSTFALAAYRLSIAADWVEEWALATAALDRAVRFRSELPSHKRMLVEALLAYNVAAAPDADQRYRAALQEHPEDVEAWYRLGELQFHDYPLIGLSPEHSQAAFERVLALDPRHDPARTHLGRLAAQRRDRAALDTLVPQLIAAKPADSLEWQHLRAFASGDRSAQRRLAAAYGALPDSVLLRLAQSVAVYARDVEGAIGMTRPLVAPDRPVDVRVAGHLLVGYLEMARGRPSAAEQELMAVNQLNPGAALAYRALFATVHFVPTPPARVRPLRDSLITWTGSGAQNPHLPLYSGLVEQDRQYLLGLLSARLADRDAVGRQLRALQGFAPAAPHPNRIPRHLLRLAAVRASLAAQAGDTVTALRLLEERHRNMPESPFASVNYFQRHLRPELLRALGREEEALRWYGAAPWTGSGNTEDALWDVVHLAPSHLARAEILERRGRPREAALHYREMIRLWRDADPELRPRVATAEQRLAQLPRTR